MRPGETTDNNNIFSFSRQMTAKKKV